MRSGNFLTMGTAFLLEMIPGLDPITLAYNAELATSSQAVAEAVSSTLNRPLEGWPG